MGEIGNLAGIEMVSGLGEDGDGGYCGFVSVRATDDKGNVLIGQLEPDEVRGLALQWLEVAEGADQDRIVMTMLTRDVHLPPDVAAKFITVMRRERRGGTDEQPELAPDDAEDGGGEGDNASS